MGSMARDATYAGARGRLTWDRAARLDARRWAWQRKVDGWYSLISADEHGRPTAIALRSGELLDPVRHGYSGLRLPPRSVLACELEIATDRSRRDRARRGFPVAHAFDVLRLSGADVSSLPFAERHARLRDAVAAASELPGATTTDALGAHHGRRDGRYVQAPARLALVECVRSLDAAWADVERDQAEGLVAVRLDGRLGQRGSKAKLKVADSIDAVITELDRRACVAWWIAGNRRIALHRPAKLELSIGSVVELAFNGWLDSGEPRHARILRTRPDLSLPR